MQQCPSKSTQRDARREIECRRAARAPELGLNPAQEAQIVATLTEHGYRVRRDDEFFATLECYL